MRSIATLSWVGEGRGNQPEYCAKRRVEDLSEGRYQLDLDGDCERVGIVYSLIWIRAEGLSFCHRKVKIRCHF